MPAYGGTLAATHIVKGDCADVILDGVWLVVPPQARIAGVKPNERGKSTLLRALAGLEEPKLRASRAVHPISRFAASRKEGGRRGVSGGEEHAGSRTRISKRTTTCLAWTNQRTTATSPGLALPERSCAGRQARLSSSRSSAAAGPIVRARDGVRCQHERDYAEYRVERERMRRSCAETPGRSKRWPRQAGGAAGRGANALVLDEPTNHLDLGVIEESEAALTASREAWCSSRTTAVSSTQLDGTRTLELDICVLVCLPLRPGSAYAQIHRCPMSSILSERRSP
jgi:hypothetical protein